MVPAVLYTNAKSWSGKLAGANSTCMGSLAHTTTERWAATRGLLEVCARKGRAALTAVRGILSGGVCLRGDAIDTPKQQTTVRGLVISPSVLRALTAALVRGC